MAIRDLLDPSDGVGFVDSAGCASSAEDHALVVGVNDYQCLPHLDGAIADARAFSAWLLDPRGGGLQAANIHTILSSMSPLRPVGDEIDEALECVLQNARRLGGRRFYFYFSGHGCTGDRPEDIALCLADWSKVRRRSSISSGEWLNVVVRSGAFDEVAVFLDCCRVWTVRAAGRPPKIDFSRPPERTRATRFFLAYGAEYRHPALEIATHQGSTSVPEVRGIFTQVLVSGLQGAAADRDDGVVTAASLKRYVEMMTQQRARANGFFQRAEVMDGFEATASFGASQCSAPYRGARPSATAPGVAAAPFEFTPASAAYEALAHATRTAIAAAVRKRTGGRGHFVTCLRIASPQPTDSAALAAEWSLHQAGGVNEPDLEQVWEDCATGWLILSARVDPGAFVLRHAPLGRELAVHVYPGWTTQIWIEQDGNAPRFETVRPFLTPLGAELLPDSAVAGAVDHGLWLLEQGTGEPPPILARVMGGGFFDDPMLGLISAHLLSRAPNVDSSRIHRLADRLEQLLGRAPDVTAVRLRAALLSGTPMREVTCADPPMLRIGLQAFVEASQVMENAVQPGSTLEHACVERMPDCPLSSWAAGRTEELPVDWLAATIVDLAEERRSDAVALDARLLAWELGVPTSAVRSRFSEIHATRARSGDPHAMPKQDIGALDPSLATPAIPGYRMGRFLGRGGMGRVHLAEHEATGERVAVKLMLPNVDVSTEARERFLREIDIIAALRHDRIVPRLAHGDVKGVFYFVMPYYARESVAHEVRRNGLPSVEGAVRITLDMLEGLAWAHAKGYVHRDIKPENVLLEMDGSAVLADFGLAKCFVSAGLTDLTKSGVSAGTAAFMPREQAVNFKHVKPAADVWAVAAMLFWMLTGKLPRQTPPGENPYNSILKRAATPIREHAPHIPEALADLVDRSLSSKVDARPADAGALREMLLRALGG